MKGIIGLLLGLLMVGCNPTINVYNQNVNQKYVNKALLLWEVEWNLVNSASEADLVIKQASPQQMRDSKNIGEYYFNSGVILINSEYYSNSSAKNLTMLIAHEIGHFFHIEHTNTPGSLMNDRAHLNTRKITSYEIVSLEQNKHKFLTYFYVRRLIKKLIELS